MEHLDVRIANHFVGTGVPSNNYFLLTDGPNDPGSIGFWHPEYGTRFVVIEDDELAAAVREYLTALGARRFSSTQEVDAAVTRGEWPSSD